MLSSNDGCSGVDMCLLQVSKVDVTVCRPHLHEMTTKPHMGKHGALEVHLLAGCTVT